MIVMDGSFDTVFSFQKSEEFHAFIDENSQSVLDIIKETADRHVPGRAIIIILKTSCYHYVLFIISHVWLTSLPRSTILYWMRSQPQMKNDKSWISSAPSLALTFELSSSMARALDF